MLYIMLMLTAALCIRFRVKNVKFVRVYDFSTGCGAPVKSVKSKNSKNTLRVQASAKTCSIK